MKTVAVDCETNIERLVGLHQTSVWRYLRLLGCDNSLADDLTQETFLAVLRRPFEERSPQATGAYLRLVARNLFIDEMRRRKRRDAAAADIGAVEEVWREHYPDDSGEERLDALRRCMDTLDSQTRSAVESHYHGGKRLKEIARDDAASEGAVKMTLLRARKTLRACMEQRLKERTR